MAASISSTNDEDIKFPDGKVAVVGIDLGTAYSGVSFVLRSDPTAVHASSPLAQSGQHKEPTVMMLYDDGRWLFGQIALNAFKNALSDGETTKNMRLFRHFKLQLLKYVGDEDIDEVVVAAKNVPRQGILLDIYTQMLIILRDHVLNAIRLEIGRAPQTTEILWVLTVPANANQWMRYFLRHAAMHAGLVTDADPDPSHLRFLHEPEAAALAVAQHVHTEIHHTSDDTSSPPIPTLQRQPSNSNTVIAPFTPGKRFVIVDCGGGTVDLSAHLVLQPFPHLQLQSLTPVTAGLWGAEHVTLAFQAFLTGLLVQVDPRMAAELRDSRAGALERVLQEFDELKVAAGRGTTLDKPYGEGQADVEPERLSLRELLDDFADDDNSTDEKHERVDLKRAFSAIVDKYNASGAPKISKFVEKTASLCLSSQLMTSFFLSVLNPIIRCVEDMLLLLRRQKTPADAVIVVGGFSGSEVLRQRLQRAFQGRVPLIFPSMKLHPQTAVVVGAALSGSMLEPTVELPPSPTTDRDDSLAFDDMQMDDYNESSYQQPPSTAMATEDDQSNNNYTSSYYSSTYCASATFQDQDNGESSALAASTEEEHEVSVSVTESSYHRQHNRNNSTASAFYTSSAFSSMIGQPPAPSVPETSVSEAASATSKTSRKFDYSTSSAPSLSTRPTSASEPSQEHAASQFRSSMGLGRHVPAKQSQKVDATASESSAMEEDEAR